VFIVVATAMAIVIITVGVFGRRTNQVAVEDILY